ncbi:MAG TPA: proline dehydrogenase family protein [Candidatus Acidoferrales bacterium]|nr:proline dehydrogenase family protein [Candidatus Acidoferrales bacterium]
MVRELIFWLSKKPAVTQAIARRGMKSGFARRFVPGETLAEALGVAEEICGTGRRISLNQLGESVKTPEEARAARDSYITMLRELSTRHIDGNISIKPTQLGLEQDRGMCESLTMEIARTAKELGLTVEMDMEGSGLTDATIEIFESVCGKFDNVGMAIQAYLFRTEKDVERLARFRPKIRLVKGAYREPAKIAYQGKKNVDASYHKLIDRLLAGDFFPIFATHDPVMVEHVRQAVRERNYPADRYEFEMLYGIRRDLQEEIHAAGQPLRVYIPFGSQWCPYFMRRLSERPANCLFVLRSLIAESAQQKSSRD